MAAAETARLVASLELQDRNFTRGLKQVERGVGRVDKKLGAFSGAVNRNVGRALDSVINRALEAPAAVVSAAIEQESAITGIAKTVNGNIDAIVDDLKRMSTETGATFTELAGIAELGGAMGIAKDDLEAFTRQVTILGATTNVSVEDAATALGQMQNVIGLTGEEFDNFTAALVDLGNKGNSTEAQILDIARRSGAAAKTIGVAKDQTLGWASAAANLGLGQEMAGTALQKFFISTQRAVSGGAEDLETLAKVSGMSAKEFRRAWGRDATGALQTFLSGLDGLTAGQRVKAIEAVYGKGQGMTQLILGLADSMDKNLNPSLETNKKAWDEATAANEEAEKRFGTSEFLFKRLGNTINLAAATIGTELLPVLNELAQEGMAWLNEPGTQQAIKGFAQDLGRGLRGVVDIAKRIPWSTIGTSLQIAGTGAKAILDAFLGLPSWVQVAIATGWGLNKITGGFIGDLFKGVLGINAGVVNVNGPVSGAGAAGGAAAGASRVGRIANAVKILGAVTIAGASILALAQTFEDFQTDVQEHQDAVTEKVNATAKQNFGETIGNLQSVVKAVNEQNDLQKVLTGVFAGGQLTQDFEMAADRIVAEQGLTRSQTITALNAMKEAQKLGAGVLKTPKLDAAILKLEARLAGRPEPGSSGGRGGAPGAFRPTPEMKEQAAKIQAVRNAIENAKSVASRENSAQKAEITNAKNAAATAGRNTSTAARTAGQTAANASRGAGVSVAASMAAAASRIVGAVNSLDLSVNVTTVNRTSTINNRYGPTGGSSTTNRSGPLE